MLILAAWIAGIPDFLSKSGPSFRPMAPLTVLAFFGLALGYLLAMLGQYGLARVAWLLPIAICGTALIEWSTGTPLGLDLLLFPEQVTRFGGNFPGRPGLLSSIAALLLSGSGYAIGPEVPSRRTSSAFIASAGVALGSALVLTVYLSALPNVPIVSVRTHLTTLAVLSLTGGIFVWVANFKWVDVLTPAGTSRLGRLLFPSALLLPLVPTIAVTLLIRGQGLAAVVADVLVVTLNIGIVAGMLFWTIKRLSRHQGELAEMSRALDVVAVAMATADGVITHWAQGCQQLYGWSPAEACGQNKYALLHSRCERWSSRGIGGGEAPGQELVEFRKDGSELHVIEHTRLIQNPGREAVLVFSMVDVSQRVAAMEALKVSEERLALATSAHELGVFEWDVPSGKVEWSPGTEQRLGLSAGMLSDFESWRAQVEPEDVQHILDTLARTVRDRADKFSFRYRFLQSQGGVRAVEGSSRAFYDSEGNLIRTVGVILDVTEREERESALRRREAQLRSVLETVPDAMVVLDQHGTIMQFSAAAEELWGYRAADVLGRSAQMLVPSDRRAAHMAALGRYVKTGEAMLGDVQKSTAEAADGRRFPIEIRTGVAHSDGQTLLTLFVRNLAEQLATEERLSELSAEIAHVSRQSAMSELAADLAHELNQPLSATSNFLAAARMLIDKGESTDRIVDLLRMGSEQTQRAGEIIRRMRAFMARGEVEMRTESVERTVRDAVDLVLVGTGQFHIRVSYDMDPEAPFIFADRIQVQQVLVNLLRNSMEALRTSGPQDRNITISSHKLNAQMVEIVVSDSGPGIPPHVLEHLFSRFTSTKGNGGGMGIGLSISKRIIEAHGGTLSADNRPEGGASFRFTLPAVEEGVE